MCVCVYVGRYEHECIRVCVKECMNVGGYVCGYVSMCECVYVGRYKCECEGM